MVIGIKYDLHYNSTTKVYDDVFCYMLSGHTKEWFFEKVLELVTG